MLIRTVLKRLNKYKPVTEDDFKDAGIPLTECLGAGSFRCVSRIADTNLSVKIPHNVYGKRHTNLEVKRIKRLRRYKELRPYLPKIYYHDKKHGIVVMPVYGEAECENFKYKYGCEALITTLIKRTTGITIKDIDECNCGINGNGHLIVVDLGF